MYAVMPRAPKLLTREICVVGLYACRILSGSVKVCRNYSRKADFKQMHIMHDSLRKLEPVSLTCKSHRSKILSTEDSFYIYDRPLTDINVIASVCALNLEIKF